MTDIIDAFIEWTSLNPQTVERIGSTLMILIIIMLVRYVTLRVLRTHVEEVKRHYRWRRGVNYLAGAVALLLIGRVWFAGLAGIGVVFGLASAGIAIALRDPIVSVVGWLFILIRRPFTVGDRIEIDGKRGDVIDVRIFHTYMVECGEWVDGDQSTGRIILVPNSTFFTRPLANYTHRFEFIWDELPVRITFESDWRRAKELLTKIVDEQVGSHAQEASKQIRHAASEYMILYQKLTPIVYTQVKEWGVLLSVRYLTPPRQRRSSSQRIWEHILDAFAKEPSIRFAYPTTRFYTDGQPATFVDVMR